MVFDATGVGLGLIKCCYGYMGRLRSVRVLWWLMGWAHYTKSVVMA